MDSIAGKSYWDGETLGNLDWIAEYKMYIISKSTKELNGMQISPELYTMRKNLIDNANLQYNSANYMRLAYQSYLKGDMEKVNSYMSLSNAETSKVTQHQRDVIFKDPLFQKVLRQ